MAQASARPAEIDGPDAQRVAFYRQVLRVLDGVRLPYMIGGGYAWCWYTGRAREPKDLDLFMRQRDYAIAEQALERAGMQCDLSFPHWLGKIYGADSYIDLIFSSGNGVSCVDDDWLVHAARAKLLGTRVRICPVEEMIWSKSFVAERERYDGADVAHLLRACAGRMDWRRLLARFGAHYRVLLSHLVLFGFVYPDERALIPAEVMQTLLDCLAQELHEPATRSRLCRGTLLSREQYLEDITQLGYVDARLPPHGRLSAEEIEHWSRAIPARS